MVGKQSSATQVEKKNSTCDLKNGSLLPGCLQLRKNDVHKEYKLRLRLKLKYFTNKDLRTVSKAPGLGWGGPEGWGDPLLLNACCTMIAVVLLGPPPNPRPSSDYCGFKVRL